MPNREFLEKYPLYRKFKLDDASSEGVWGRPAIHMICHHCDSEQTFNMGNNYYEGFTEPPEERDDCSFRLVYRSVTQ